MMITEKATFRAVWEISRDPVTGDPSKVADFGCQDIESMVEFIQEYADLEKVKVWMMSADQSCYDILTPVQFLIDAESMGCEVNWDIFSSNEEILSVVISYIQPRILSVEVTLGNGVVKVSNVISGEVMAFLAKKDLWSVSHGSYYSHKNECKVYKLAFMRNSDD